MRQNIIAADLVVQDVEAITGFSLRFGLANAVCSF